MQSNTHTETRGHIYNMYDILAYRIKRPKLTYSRKNPLENIGGKESVRTKKKRDREREGIGSLTPTQRQGDIYPV